MKAVLYATPHGFGHAVRMACLAEHYLKTGALAEVVIAAGNKQADFLRSGFSIPGLYIREIPPEPGLPLRSDFRPDLLRLACELPRWIRTWDAWIANEIDFVRAFSPAFLISDCSPQPLLLAHEARIPSILVSNFTWGEIYAPLLPASKDISFLNSVYETASEVIKLPGGSDSERADSGFFSRRPHPERVAQIRLAADGDPIVFFSMGRMAINGSSFDLFGVHARIFSTKGTVCENALVEEIPLECCHTQDYVAAADLVVTKAGWATLAEAVNNRRPILLLQRPRVSEDANAAAFLRSKGVASVCQISDYEPQRITQALANRYEAAARYDESDWWKDDTASVARTVILAASGHLADQVSNT
ncbi:MAG: glycosyltransferase [Candidatus Brocadiia bacterium]